MPCYDTGSREGDLEQSLDEARTSATRTAELLCSAMRNVETLRRRHRLALPMPDNVESWWREHKKKDARRKREEDAERREQKLRAQAIRRLTPAERRALNLRGE